MNRLDRYSLEWPCAIYPEAARKNLERFACIGHKEATSEHPPTYASWADMAHGMVARAATKPAWCATSKVDTADRQRPRRERHPPVRHRSQELVVQRPPKAPPPAGKFYSLIETAKANGREPYAWLRHILEHLPTAQSVEDYEALQP
nr:transposase domain-containing protein [Stutzerimonas balearica]